MNMETALVGLLTFFLGLLLGHRLSLYRDRRKEFNEAAAPIRDWLLINKDEPSPYRRWPSDSEFDRFTHYLWFWQKSKFTALLSEFKKSHQETQPVDTWGHVAYKNPQAISQLLNELFRLTKRR